MIKAMGMDSTRVAVCRVARGASKMIKPMGISHYEIQDKSQDYCKQRQFHNLVPSTGVSL